MRRLGVLVPIALLLLAGCTADPAPATTTSPPPLPTAAECPAGTSLRSDLCLAEGALADALSDIVHAQFADARLNAVIAGVWHDGEPVLVGALGES
ncbi:MAG: hypothetical protein M3Y29_03195, partial [Chloroflexota bacterium]|nr:hypothetical protein [Chloroflexota bacterium]